MRVNKNWLNKGVNKEVKVVTQEGQKIFIVNSDFEDRAIKVDGNNKDIQTDKEKDGLVQEIVLIKAVRIRVNSKQD